MMVPTKVVAVRVRRGRGIKELWKWWDVGCVEIKYL